MTTSDLNKGVIQVARADNGKGIPEAAKNTLSEAFKRTKAAKGSA